MIRFGHMLEIFTRSEKAKANRKSLRALLLYPAIVLAIVLLVPFTRARSTTSNVLSTWGVYVSILVYFLAQGTKTEAEQARSQEQLRIAQEQATAAATRCREIEEHANSATWSLARLRAREVIDTCRTEDARWRSHTHLNGLRGKLEEVKEAMRTIIDETSKQQPKAKTITKSSRDSDEALTDVIGKISEQAAPRRN